MYCGRMFLFLYRFCSKQFLPAAFNLGFSDACEFCVLNCCFFFADFNQNLNVQANFMKLSNIQIS